LGPRGREKPRARRARASGLRARLVFALCLIVAAALAVALLLVTPRPANGITVFAVALAFGLALALIVSDAFIRPVRELTEAALRAMRGEPGARIAVRGDDDFARLAAAFNALSDTARERKTEADASQDEVRSFVRRLGEALRSTHDLRKMLSVVLETAIVAVRGSSGAVYLLNAKRTELYVKVGRHLDVRDAEQRLAIGRGLAGVVAQRGESARYPAADAPVPEDPEPVTSTALAVPLNTRSQLLGVLAIYGREGDVPFTESDLEAITTLASQAGVGIENVLLHQEAERLSITDGLTSVWNHRYFQMRYPQEFESAIRTRRTLALFVIDIDHFKQINDRYGHQRGDAILVELSQRLVANVRFSSLDTLARYGGEEFVLVVPEIDAGLARQIGEKIRGAVANTPFGGMDEAPVNVSVSIGFAVYPDHGLTPQVLMRAADRAMYEAKARGRDRVVGAEELAPDPTLASEQVRP
jgi:diguanylate cyclase (GGDEF)-like protein